MLNAGCDRPYNRRLVEGISRPSVQSDVASRSSDRFVKRSLDIVVALVALVVLSPVLLVVSAVVWLDSGLPILYRCERLGRGGRPLTMLKFRSMRDGSHHHLSDLLANDDERRLEYERQRKLRDDPRKTRVGGFLRRTSLDEVPQLWNVLVGDMSLVGPRPYFRDELNDRPERDTLLAVRPGLTGLWQINGRSERTFEERLGLELEYVRNASFAVDLAILAKTAGAVIKGRGAY